MKIYDTSTSASAPETGRAPEAHRTDRETAARSSTAKNDGGDHVQLSGNLGRLSQVLNSFGSSRASRVEALATQYRAGQYQVDTGATSSGMVVEALAGGAG